MLSNWVMERKPAWSRTPLLGFKDSEGNAYFEEACECKRLSAENMWGRTFVAARRST